MKIIKIAVVSVALLGIFGCSACQRGNASQIAAYTEYCKSVSEDEIAQLFDRWNKTLQTGDSRKVVELYAEKSILLPTVSNKPRLTAEEKEGYFHHFLEKKPVAKIDLRQIQIGCNMAVDSGLYTFTFAKTGEVVRGRYSFVYRWDGSQWLIVSHHSSMMPEVK
ncbi:MAG: SgcJ/EcaC family oxidoreductase [Candidatus Omnitrophica bacterium]|nr:SgcJ/EcaC family oxidoreductase [Candidatus Omnitrophota bacterium]